MNPATQAIHSVLYVDIGSVNTRVCLFESVDEKFSFIGAASAKTPHLGGETSEYLGVVEAIQKLERAAKRKILDRNQNIVMPVTLDRAGIDQVAVSYTCIDDPRVAVMGLTRSGSLRNLKQLLAKCAVEPVAGICAEEGKPITENLDTLLNVSPRIVVVSGGTEAGAEKAVFRLGETLMLACKSLPREQRPAVLFLGNSAAKNQMDRVFSKITQFSSAANVSEPGSGARSSLNGFVNALRYDAERRSPGFKVLREKTKCSIVPGAFAFGRSVRLMSRLIRQNHHVLGIDLGASQTIFADAVNLNLQLNAIPIGVGGAIHNLLEHFDAEEIQNWISFQIKSSEIEDYIRNKSLYPDLIPANNYSAEIEQAVARCIFQYGVRKTALTPLMDSGSLSTVFLSGALLRNVEDPGDALRIAMDSLLPAGMVDYLLDMNGLAGAIGTLAHLNPTLTAQILNASTYLSLGKVIRPLIHGDLFNKPAMTIALQDDAGSTRRYDIPQGRIYRIPLDYGKNYELNWINLPRGVTLPGVKTYVSTGFKSGCFGLVFDTRPVRSGKLLAPKDRAAVMGKLKEWKEQLGPWMGAAKEDSNE